MPEPSSVQGVDQTAGTAVSADMSGRNRTNATGQR